MSQTGREAYLAGAKGEATERQAEVLDYIKGYMGEHGVPPTVREIGKAMGINNPNGVISNLKSLIRKGLLRSVGKGLSRSYVPVVPDGCCPCCGRPND